MLRLYVDLPLAADAVLTLPPDTARHVQVLRHQPGDVVTLFNGAGGEWLAEVITMGRRDVTVQVTAHQAVDRERPGHVTIAVGMPANERFDWLIEKATELGVHTIQPLMCERSVLKVQGERAERKVAHWQGIACAAAEQSGRTRVPAVRSPLPLRDYLASLPAGEDVRLMLSLHPSATPLADPGAAAPVTLLSGPEGGLSAHEESVALARGFRATTLGPRVLRAETAPLACLARLQD